MFDKLPRRSRELWVYWALKLRSKLAEQEEWSVDVSQQLSRTHVHSKICGCFTGSSRIVLLRQQRLITGREALHMNGVDAPWVSKVLDPKANSLLWSLSGNSYSAGPVLVALICLFDPTHYEDDEHPHKRRRLMGKQPVGEGH